MLVLGLVGSTILGFLNQIGTTIVGALAAVLDLLFQLTMQIALTNLFTDKFIEEVARNLYSVIGYYMVIRMSLVLLKYISNPENNAFKNSANKESILPVMIGRFISVAVLVAVAPQVFSILRSVQPALVDFAFQVVNTNSTEMASNGSSIEMLSCKYKKTSGLTKTINEARRNSNGDIVLETCPAEPEVGWVLISSSIYYEADMGRTLSSAMVKPFLKINPLIDQTSIDVEEYEGYINDSDDANYYTNLLKAMNDKGDTATGEKEVIIKFQWPLALVCIVVAGIMIIQSILKIAMRTIKLSLLEIISPLAIMAYIDPSADIKKEDNFTGRYIKLYTKTYMELFVWVITLAVIVLALSSLDELTIFRNNWIAGVLIIFALLKGLNDIPPLLSKLFTGEASTADAGFIGKMGAKATGAVTGTLSGAAAGAGKGLLRGGLKGAAGGALAGGAAGGKDGFDKGYSFEGENKAKESADYMSGFGVGADQVKGKGALGTAMSNLNSSAKEKGSAMLSNKLARKGKMNEMKADKLRESAANMRSEWDRKLASGEIQKSQYDDGKSRIEDAASAKEAEANLIENQPKGFFEQVKSNQYDAQNAKAAPTADDNLATIAQQMTEMNERSKSQDKS